MITALSPFDSTNTETCPGVWPVDGIRVTSGVLRGLPEQQRKRSALALLDAYRVPERPVRGAIAPTAEFQAAVRTAKVGPAQGIPHVSVELIRKYLTDLKELGLV